MNCKYCGVVLPEGSNPRQLFCSDAHKQAYWRKQHSDGSQELLSSQVKALSVTVESQAQIIESLASEIARLRELLDIERRYLEDTKQRGFIAWLKKQDSTLKEKILGDRFMLPRDTKSHYEYRLRYALHCNDEELREFTRLWKLMLISQP